MMPGLKFPVVDLIYFYPTQVVYIKAYLSGNRQIEDDLHLRVIWISYIT